MAMELQFLRELSAAFLRSNQDCALFQGAFPNYVKKNRRTQISLEPKLSMFFPLQYCTADLHCSIIIKRQIKLTRLKLLIPSTECIICYVMTDKMRGKTNSN